MKQVSKVGAADAASVSAANESADPGLQRPARALLGWMHTDAAILVLNSNQQTPGTPEQREIVRRIDKLLTAGERIAARLELVSRQVDRSANAMLAKAFRGELGLNGSSRPERVNGKTHRKSN